MDELNRHFEAIVAEFLRTRKLRSSQDSALREVLGRYPSGWAWETDAQNQFLWCSPEIHSLLGYDPSDLIGRSFTSLTQTTESMITLQKAFSSLRPIYNLRIASKTKAGKNVTPLLTAIQRISRSSSPQGYRGVAQVIEVEELLPETKMPMLPEEVEERAAPPITAPLPPSLSKT